MPNAFAALSGVVFLLKLCIFSSSPPFVLWYDIVLTTLV
jgi:hypothetical protein